MTSSAEIHNVQEVLNNLTNSMKGADLEQTFSAVIAQHTAEQKAREDAEAASAQAVAVQGDGQEQQQAQQHAVDHEQLGHEQLERIAQQHQQEQHAQQQQHHHHQHGETSSSAAPDAVVVAAATAVAPEQQVIHMDTLDSNDSSTLATVPIPTASPAEPPVKPLPGSEEWAKMRRDTHKEVERRRRETINEGINELAKVVPNSEKNKGAILRQAVKYVVSIQEAHEKLSSEVESVHAMIVEREKALLDKNLAQSALNDLNTQHEQLKREFEALKSEYDTLASESANKKARTE